jgi:CheY-like chemotaxis protein
MSTILVVDPNPDFRYLVNEMLSNLGHQVVGLQKSDRAPELAGSLKPDLLIMDILMDRSPPGCGALTKIKNDPRTAATPVVACSPLTDEQIRTQSGQMMPFLSGVLARPFDIEDLERMVTGILERAGPPYPA